MTSHNAAWGMMCQRPSKNKYSRLSSDMIKRFVLMWINARSSKKSCNPEWKRGSTTCTNDYPTICLQFNGREIDETQLLRDTGELTNYLNRIKPTTVHPNAFTNLDENATIEKVESTGCLSWLEQGISRYDSAVVPVAQKVCKETAFSASTRNDRIRDLCDNFARKFPQHSKDYVRRWCLDPSALKPGETPYHCNPYSWDACATQTEFSPSHVLDTNLVSSTRWKTTHDTKALCTKYARSGVSDPDTVDTMVSTFCKAKPNSDECSSFTKVKRVTDPLTQVAVTDSYQCNVPGHEDYPCYHDARYKDIDPEMHRFPPACIWYGGYSTSALKKQIEEKCPSCLSVHTHNFTNHVGKYILNLGCATQSKTFTNTDLSANQDQKVKTIVWAAGITSLSISAILGIAHVAIKLNSIPAMIFFFIIGLLGCGAGAYLTLSNSSG